MLLALGLIFSLSGCWDESSVHASLLARSGLTALLGPQLLVFFGYE